MLVITSAHCILAAVSLLALDWLKRNPYACDNLQTMGLLFLGGKKRSTVGRINDELVPQVLRKWLTVSGESHLHGPHSPVQIFIGFLGHAHLIHWVKALEDILCLEGTESNQSFSDLFYLVSRYCIDSHSVVFCRIMSEKQRRTKLVQCTSKTVSRIMEQVYLTKSDI